MDEIVTGGKTQDGIALSQEDMDEIVTDGKTQDGIALSQEDIELLLGIVDVIDDLDDDEVLVIDGIVRALPEDSAYGIPWFYDKLIKQRKSPRQE